MQQSSKEYWMKRAKEDAKRNLENEEAGISKLNSAFKNAESKITLAIEKFYSKYATDGKISIQEARKRLAPGELATMRKQFLELSKTASTTEEKAYLKQLSGRIYISRQEALLAEIRHHVTELASQTDTTVNDHLQNVFSDEYLHQQFNIETFFNQGFSFEKLSDAQLYSIAHTNWSVDNFSQAIWYDRDKLVHTIEMLVPQRFIVGTSSQELAKTLAKTMNTSYNNAIRIVRTEGTYMATKADMQAYESAGIEEYEYVATLDDRTSEVCRDLDGMIFKVAQKQSGVNAPPMHPNCRSTTVPNVDTSDLVEERLAKDENGKYIYVPKQTYRQWEETRKAS